MKLKVLAILLAVIPSVSFSAVRSDAARVGVQRAGGAGARAPSMTQNVKQSSKTTNKSAATKTAALEEEEEYEEEYEDEEVLTDEDVEEVGEEEEKDTKESKSESKNENKSASCRDAYRECMDEFCLLDESEGYRCACSSNINKSKSLIQEIQKIQEEADKLSVLLNKKGFHTVALHSDNSDEQLREQRISELEDPKNPLEYILKNDGVSASLF